MFQNRQGIAPIVATLLLISFAVAIGIVIMNFGRAQVQLESKCAVDIGLIFSEIGGETQVCIDREKDIIRLSVENGVNIETTGLMVNVIGTERAESFELSDATIAKAGVYLTDLGYNLAANGEIRQLKVIPLITPFDEEVVCTEQALVAESIPDC
jgi:hypothetical protein